MEKLKVVSIGGFGHSVFVFDEMQKLEQVELVGLSPAYEGEDISFFTNHALCKGVKVFGDYKQMIKETGAKVAIISSRLDVIPKVTMEAAKMGCHLICEKPLAIDHQSLEELYNVIKKTGVKLTAMLSMRNDEPFRAAKQVYESGVIGEAILVNGRKSYKWGTRAEWFGDRKLYGGTIGWVGIHAFDFINSVTGLEFTEVAAMQGNFAHPERKDCEDNCSICCTLTNGGHGSISVDLLRPAAASTHGDDWIRVVGTKGVLESRACTGKCEVITSEKSIYEVPLPAKGRMFEEFLLSILDGRKLIAGAKEAFMLTDVCLCARDSADKKQFVKVNSNKWQF